MHCLARDAGVSQATGYRYLREGIDVLADQAPGLHEILKVCQESGITHVILDDTLIECDRVAGVRENSNDLSFSQKHKAFGGNVQFLASPDGTPLWVSEVEPGSTPDITATRIHVLPALYRTAAEGLPTPRGQGLHRRRNWHPRPGPPPQGADRTDPSRRHPHHERADQRTARTGRAHRRRAQ